MHSLLSTLIATLSTGRDGSRGFLKGLKNLQIKLFDLYHSALGFSGCSYENEIIVKLKDGGMIGWFLYGVYGFLSLFSSIFCLFLEFSFLSFRQVDRICSFLFSSLLTSVCSDIFCNFKRLWFKNPFRWLLVIFICLIFIKQTHNCWLIENQILMNCLL